ncbi:MAG: hypothetical protein K8953_02395, partial [Proteobacteria bacterium]|nr:hypothetical protein [Pseudomonadota bacterium]
RDVDGTVTLGGKKFIFDGDFTDKGIISGAVSVADVSDQGSFNGLIGVRGAAGVFKNNDSNSQGQFVGGFVVTPVLETDGTVDFDDWVNSGVSGLLAEGDARAQRTTDSGTFFIRGTDTGIKDINTRLLTLTSDANSGIAFGEYHRNTFDSPNTKTYFTGLLSDTNVGRHIENKNLNGIWKGEIHAYVDGGNLTAKTDFYLDVDFGASGLTGDDVGKVESTTVAGVKGPVGLGNGNIHINGYFNAFGVMSGDSSYLPNGNNRSTSLGTFNGLIGTLGAVGVFKDTTTPQKSSFAGGFVANPPTEETQ